MQIYLSYTDSEKYNYASDLNLNDKFGRRVFLFVNALYFNRIAVASTNYLILNYLRDKDMKK